MKSEHDVASWKARYIRHLVKRGLLKKEAYENYKAGVSCHDLSFLPEDAADDELSYWIND